MAENKQDISKVAPNVIQVIQVKQVVRKTQDIANWTKALQSAENANNPRRIDLYDLYFSLMLDAHLTSVIDKRKNAITNTPIQFTINGKEQEDITRITRTPYFSKMLSDVIDTLMWGHSLLEFTFIPDMIRSFLIPRKHVVPEKGIFTIRQGDMSGFNYRQPPYDNFVLEVGETNDLGLLLKAAPYIIYKRGGFADWSQFSEIFGMPMRVGKYKGYDDATRLALTKALDEAGSALSIVIPEEADLQILDTFTKTPAGGLYSDLINACNAELSKLILGNTLTTEQGDKGARSLGEVHAEVEKSVHDSDKQYVMNFLNFSFKRLMEIHGFKIGDGEFSFVEAENIPKEKLIDIHVKLKNLIPMDDDFLYETYGVPKPDNYDEIMRQREEERQLLLQPPGDDDPLDDEDKQKKVKNLNTAKELKLLRRVLSFFVAAPVSIPGHTSILNKADERLLDDLFRDYVQELHSGNLRGNKLHYGLYNFTAEKLITGLMESYGRMDYSWNSPDNNMLAYLKANIFQFSGAKNLDMFHKMSRLLLDENGKLKTPRQFERDVLEIDKTYNRVYLETEYHNAVAQGQMAGKWLDIQANKAVAPYLEYRTAGDERVRRSHQALDGLTAKVDDPIWDTIYPPDDWNCRCTVVQISKPVRISSQDDLLQATRNANIRPTFKNNVGKTGVVYNDSHPYFINTKFKEVELKAVQNYGMNPVEQIYRRKDGLAKLTTFDTVEQYQDHWSKLAGKYGKDNEFSIQNKATGMYLNFDETLFKKPLKNRYADQERYKITGNLEGLVKEPDEVFTLFKSRQHAEKPELITVFIKYYDNNPMVLVSKPTSLDGTLRVASYYQVDKTGTAIDDLRRGILVYRKTR